MSRVRPQRRRGLSVLNWRERLSGLRAWRAWMAWVRVARRVGCGGLVVVLWSGCWLVEEEGGEGRKPGAELQYRLSVGISRTAEKRIWPSIRRKK